MQDWDSEGASYAEMPVGTLPGNYEEVYGPTTKAVLRRRYWDRGAGNTRMRSYVPVDYGTSSYGGGAELFEKAGASFLPTSSQSTLHSLQCSRRYVSSARASLDESIIVSGAW